MNEILKSLVLAELDEDIQVAVDPKDEQELVTALLLQAARYQRYTQQNTERTE